MTINLSTASLPKPLGCVSCGARLRGKYCHACGEKAFDPHDHSLKHFLEELIHTVTHIDNKFLKSLYALFCKPGVLTRDYIAGKKKSFTKPITLFIIGNVLYFFVQPLVNINSFNFEIAFFLICIVYLACALHFAYRQKPVVTLAQGVAATVGFVVSLFVYRIILFLMTYAIVS